MCLRLVTLIVAFFECLSPATARAQSVVLPKIDSIDFFGQVGDFEGGDAVDAKTLGPFGTYGWGFETTFNLNATNSNVELGVGYDQLYLHSKFRDGFVLSGEVRDLPNVSVYVSFRDDLYVGLATGIVSLANASINNRASRFTVTGDTFDVAAKAGYAIPFQSGVPSADRRVNGFVEADYHARYFGGINYGNGAPADLPSRVYLGGFTVVVGVQVSLGKTKVDPKSDTR